MKKSSSFVPENKKTVSDSLVLSTYIVMPNDTNFLSYLMGGNVMKWMDVVAATAAMKHSNAKCVTASVDNLLFKRRVHLGSVVRIEALVTRAFGTSMETYIRVYEESHVPSYSYVLTNEAYYTFVAVNDFGSPVSVPPIYPETEEQKKWYEMAEKRRKIRLFLAQRITLSQEEIGELFSSHS